MVLALPELDARPDLVTQLIASVRRIAMPLHGLLRMVAQLTLAEDVELGVLAEQIYRSAMKRRESQELPNDAMIFLVQSAPRVRCNSSNTRGIHSPLE